MLNLDKSGIDRLLLEMEDIGAFDSGYCLSKDDSGNPEFLGCGSVGYVYEMYSVKNPEMRFAAKLIGCDARQVDSEEVVRTAQIQYTLSDESENIVKVVALWTMKLIFDEDGKLAGIIRENETEYNTVKASQIHIILMEKLDDIIKRDKYGNTELLRDDLKTEDGVIKFAKDIARALFTVHISDCLHRDVKLENISWDKKSGTYKLGDFGIAKFLDGGAAETVAFTDGYGAPEIECRLADNYDDTADIYSFGVTLFLLLNDLHFPASDRYVVNAQIQYSPDFVFPAPAHASEEMAAVIRKMCGYRSEDRYQSIEEVLMDIGRIDGSYTENGFEDTSDGENTEILEGELLTTAFYTEVTDGDSNEVEQPESTSAHKDNKVGTTRFHRKVMEQIYNERYTWSGIWHFLLSALLFFALFKAFPPEAEYADDWMLLVLPAALLAEAVLQRAKELHILIGSFLCVLCLYSIYIKGFDILHAVTIAVVIFEIPSLTAGCAVGAGLWLVQMATGACAWLNVLNRFDCGWIVIILLFVVVDGMMDACIKYHKTSYVRVCIWNFISFFLWIALVVAGIVLIVGKSKGSIAVPDIFSRIHLIRVGVGIFLLQTVTFRRFKIVQFVKEGWL